MASPLIAFNGQQYKYGFDNSALDLITNYFTDQIQLFKTSILPYFDYCPSLIIYFPKSSFQSLNTFFDFCLYRLVKFRTEISSIYKNGEDKLMDDFINKLNDYFGHELQTSFYSLSME